MFGKFIDSCYALFAAENTSEDGLPVLEGSSISLCASGKGTQPQEQVIQGSAQVSCSIVHDKNITAEYFRTEITKITQSNKYLYIDWVCLGALTECILGYPLTCQLTAQLFRSCLVL